MKPKVILLIYGEGGHKAEMDRFFQIVKRMGDIQYVGLYENVDKIENIINFRFIPLRNKYSMILTLIKFPLVLFLYGKTLVEIVSKYDVVGVVSTGPGIAIFPSLFFKVISVPIVFIETWSRFETKSLTGRVMCLFADKFYVQTREQLKHYPKAIYSGTL